MESQSAQCSDAGPQQGTEDGGERTKRDGHVTEYEFFVAQPVRGKFAVANTAIRSHAMKNALRSRAAKRSGSSSLDSSLARSEDTVSRRSELTGRWKLQAPQPAGKAAKSARDGSHGRRHEDRGMSRTAVGSRPHNSGHEDTLLSAEPVEWFRNGEIDPFQSLPIPGNRMVDSLIKYCEFPPP
jgi:hypothetical protein